MSTAIKIEKLSKRFIIGHKNNERYSAFRDVLSNGAKNSLRHLRDLARGGHGFSRNISREEFWALRDIDLDVQHGDRVGIIGRNGAGKSTLLKVLCRITEPTRGKVTIKGRVASLLEVGTGFHPELTGRENIFLNGAILGMSKAEINNKFDEIVSFAEIERFLDTPVKRYSSGMYVRLAFSVAAHIEPEILIVDEVLAVGDAAFQKKCLGKMEDVGKEGRTVLFVSHQMAAVQNLCQKGVVLNQGQVEYQGTQVEAVSRYLTLNANQASTLADRKDRRGTQDVRVESIEFVDYAGRTIDSAVSGQELGIRLHYKKYDGLDLSKINVGIAVKTPLGIPVFLQHSRLGGYQFGPLSENGYFEFRIDRLMLPPSSYQITYSLINDGIYIDGVADAAELLVSEGDYFGTGEVPPISHGVCLVDGEWSVQSTGKF
jgi:lipopolysaccharide transport system ATP-binding protein